MRLIFRYAAEARFLLDGRIVALCLPWLWARTCMPGQTVAPVETTMHMAIDNEPAIDGSTQSFGLPFSNLFARRGGKQGMHHAD